jgi:hypothetical protein
MDAWVWIVIAVVVLAVLAAVALNAMRRRQRHRLQSRFGPEYDRALDDADNRRAAEHDLREREAKREQLELRPLSAASRARYEQQWSDMQSGFVDRPQVAVADADRLITDLMRERGYPVDDFDTRSELVSVDHPQVVENYRTAHSIAAKNIEGNTSTEELRQAVISYRALFEEMLTEHVDEPRSQAAATQAPTGNSEDTNRGRLS